MAEPPIECSSSNIWILSSLCILLCLASCKNKFDFYHVDFHNDRSFFLTGKEIPFVNCGQSEICRESYQNSVYFFSLWRPRGKATTGRPWRLSPTQAQKLNSLSYFGYLQTALADLKSLGYKISKKPNHLLRGHGYIFLGLEGAHLLQHQIRPENWPTYKTELSKMVAWLGKEKFAYVGLSHSTPNVFAGNQHQQVGLSAKGRFLISLLIKEKILIDLSHSSAATARDLFALTNGAYPLFYSHSAAFKLCPHKRNLSDAILDLVKQSQGLVAVIYYPQYLTCSAKATIGDVVKHMLYLRKTIGIDHIGLGSDFDSFINLPQGLNSPVDVPKLGMAMLAAGFTEEEVQKIFYLNAFRLLKAAQDFVLPPLDECPNCKGKGQSAKNNT